ncbi:hypothetical protein [Methylobacterium sp. WL12]|nr:hypothetical protein [Methylobacterium sp. WL12]
MQIKDLGDEAIREILAEALDGMTPGRGRRGGWISITSTATCAWRATTST